MNFLDLGLSEQTIKAINEFGIRKPTTIQTDVIPSILQGRDVFTIAPQKCGKTTSYVFPLVDIISKHNKQNILIITPSSEEAVVVSDRLSVFNKYHNISETTIKDAEEDVDNEANVIIASPDLLLEIVNESKLDLSNINILVVDDINLIKKNKQLDNLGKILDMLPADKQNIVYTNRRSKETQDILDRILKAPEEIKVDKNKEQEAEEIAHIEPVILQEAQESKEQIQQEPREERKSFKDRNRDRNHNKDRNRDKETRNSNYNVSGNGIDYEAANLAKKYNSFNGRTPKFILSKSTIAEGE